MDLAGSICDDAVCMAMWFALATGPFVFVAAITITLLARRIARNRGKVVPGWVWGMTFVGLVVILFPGAYGVLKLREHSQAERQYEASVRSIDYQTYWPAEHPKGFEVAGVLPPAYSPRGAFTVSYDTPIGHMQAFQSSTIAGEAPPDPEDCQDDDPDDSETTSIGIPRSRCRLLITPEGNEVVITTSSEGCDAVLEIRTTRLTIECLALDDDSIARYFDSMEPIDTMDIEFSKPRLDLL